MNLVTFAPSLPDWHEIRLADALKRSFSAPIQVENDVNLAVIAERWRGVATGVSAYLTKPIDDRALDAGIRLAASRHEEFRALEAEVSKAQQALEDRKLIEQAKGILMTAIGIPEPEAFRRIQRAARDRNLKLVDVARRILEQRSLLSGSSEPEG